MKGGAAGFANSQPEPCRLSTSSLWKLLIAEGVSVETRLGVTPVESIKIKIALKISAAEVGSVKPVSF